MTTEDKQVLENLGYEVWPVEDGILAERRTSGLIYRLYYSDQGELRLEKERVKPETVFDGMLGGKNGQYIRREEVRETFFTAADNQELLMMIKAWESWSGR